MTERRISQVCTFLFLAINMPFWFVDEHVPLIAQRLLGLGLLAVAAMTAKKLKMPPVLILLFAFFILMNASKFFVESLSLQSAAWFTGLPVLIALSLLFSMDRESLGEVFGSLTWLTIAVTVPAIIVWFCILFQVDLPYSMISLHGRPAYDRSYAGLAIFIDYTIYNFGNVSVGRLAGMFEEPGMLGTIVGVFLVTDILFFPKVYKARKLALASIGILTFSLAFFVLFLLVLVYIIIVSKARIAAAILVASLAIGLVSSQSVVSQVAELFFIGRLAYDPERGFFGNNRAVYGDRFFNEYVVHASPVRILLGNGPSSNSENDEGQFNSYLGVIYSDGLLATLLLVVYIGYFASIPVFQWRQPLAFLLLLGPLLSLYQRPDVTGIHYLLLFSLLFVHRDTVPNPAPQAPGLKAALI